MKILVLLLISCVCNAQFRKEIPSLSLTFISGFADGSAESLKWHYDAVDKKFNLNDNYWNPNISWRNKYAGGLSANGPKFMGSTTYLVWTTDGYHMLRAARNLSITTAIVIHPWRKKKWYMYVADGVIHYVVYNAGFYLSYNVITK